MLELLLDNDEESVLHREESDSEEWVEEEEIEEEESNDEQEICIDGDGASWWKSSGSTINKNQKIRLHVGYEFARAYSKCIATGQKEYCMINLMEKPIIAYDFEQLESVLQSVSQLSFV